MKKKLLGILLIAIMLVGTLAACGDKKDDDKKAEKIGEGTISINAQIAADRGDEQAINGGHILKEKKVDIHKGDTAVEALVNAAKKEGIEIKYEGDLGKNTAYVTEINGVKATDNGYGWTYFVNGEMPKFDGDKPYELKDGDKVEWHYSDGKNLG